MPLYTGDYLRDTRHLSPLRHGVYLLALMHCWDSQGPMPLDEQECAGICNCRSSDEIEAMRYVIGRYFIKMDDGHYNKRMADEVARFAHLSSKFSEAGRKSAEARRAKAREGRRVQTEQRTAVLGAALNLGSTDVQPTLNLGETEVEPRSVSPSPSPTKEKHIRAAKARPSATPDGFAAFWAAWPNTDRKTGKKKCGEKWERMGFELKATEIVAHVELMKGTQKWRDHFEPAPLTYLNGELWGDGVQIEESTGDELRDIFARAL